MSWRWTESLMIRWVMSLLVDVRIQADLFVSTSTMRLFQPQKQMKLVIGRRICRILFLAHTLYVLMSLV